MNLRSHLITLFLTIIVIIVLEVTFKSNINVWATLLIPLAIHSIVSFITKEEDQNRNVVKANRGWPISGPIGNLGRSAIGIVFFGTSIFSLLNPFQVVEILRQLFGNFQLRLNKSGLIDNVNDYQHETEYRLPFEKNIEWLVINGGIDKINSHSWNTITQRFAYDFVIANDIYVRHENNGTKVKDYFCYNLDILAAADGFIVKVVNNIGTAPFVGYGLTDIFAKSFIGNHVIIKHRDNEYTFYAHLVKGSINVKVGEVISQGDILGRCGHTGYSTEPHLHFHLQDKADFFTANGLPIRFSHLKINGESSNSSYISVSHRVENL